MGKVLSSIHKILYFGQRWLLFGFVGALSLYPTVTYVLWALPLSKGELPNVTSKLVSRLRVILNIELVGFASIPFFATLMARGIGLT